MIRENGMEQSRRIAVARVFVTNALHGRRCTQYIDEKSLSAYRLYYNPIYTSAIVATFLAHLFIVSQLEPVASCQQGAISAPIGATIASLACTALYTFDVGLQFWFRGGRYMRTHIWFALRCLTIAVMFSDDILTLVGATTCKFSRPLRPIMILGRLINVRMLFVSVLETIPRTLNIALLLTFQIVFFSFLGLGIFRDLVVAPSPTDYAALAVASRNGTVDYFASPGTSVESLFTLLSTVNYPDVALPYFRKGKWTGVFFVLYLIIGLYFLLNLLLAVVYQNYREHTLGRMVTRLERRKRGLRLAFRSLSGQLPDDPTTIYIANAAEELDVRRPVARLERACRRMCTCLVKREEQEHDPLQDTLNTVNTISGNVFPDSSRMSTGADNRRDLSEMRRQRRSLPAGQRPQIEKPAVEMATRRRHNSDFPDGENEMNPLHGRVPPPSQPIGRRQSQWKSKVGLNEVASTSNRILTGPHDVSKGLLSKATWRELVKSLRGQDATDEADIFFATVDLSSRGFITETQFIDMCEFLRVRLPKRREQVRVEAKGFWGLVRLALFRLATNPWLLRAFDILVVVNCVVIFAQSSVEGEVLALSVMAQILLACFVVELTIVIGGLGLTEFLRSSFNIIDLVSVASALTFEVVHLTTRNTDAEQGFLSVVRIVRILRALRVLKQYSTIASALRLMLPVLLRFVTVMVLVFFFFASIGMEVFAGKISTESIRVSQFAAFDYYPLTFDSIGEAFFTLFALLIVNNWHIIQSGYIEAVGPKVRFFFYSFYILTALVVSNVVIAFVLETFMSHWSMIRTHGRTRPWKLRVLTAMHKLDSDDGDNRINRLAPVRKRRHSDVFKSIFIDEIPTDLVSSWKHVHDPEISAPTAV